ncbi:hypothetical protein B9Z46_04570 [Limnohabitans sp. Hippo4]|nr:hypothetical protein B9Z46_04570 [Limnohabitans sp. Hippo4]
MSGTSLFAADITAGQKQEIPTRESQETAWYVQGMVGQGTSGNQALTVSLGGPVKLEGVANYGAGPVYGIAIGKQWLGSPKNNEAEQKQQSDKCPQVDHLMKEGVEPKRISEREDDCLPLRAEVEFWGAKAKRESISVGALKVTPLDTVRVNAVFLNGAFRLAESEELQENLLPTWRTWLGAGIGYANMEYPDVRAISGCNCFAALSDSGLAVQLKLMIERQLSENTQLVFQAGRVWLPSIQSPDAQMPQTQWHKRNVNQLLIGLRHSFR